MSSHRDAPKATKMDGYEEGVVGMRFFKIKFLSVEQWTWGLCNAKVGDVFLQPARDIFGKRELKER